MLADAVDIDTAHSDDARTGSCFALLGFLSKCAMSFGGLSLPLLPLLPLLALVGCDATPSATSGTPERHARLQSALRRRRLRLGERQVGLASE